MNESYYNESFKNKTYKRIICHTLSTDFRKATKIETVSFPPSAPPPHKVIIQNYHLGINASDINYTNGRYLPNVKPPFAVGFESVGIIVYVGSKVTKFKIGDAVSCSIFGSFSEYLILSQHIPMKIPVCSPAILPLMVCGCTASIALTEVGQLTHDHTILITAAAGATGQFAVQLAKLMGCHVIGTCSSDVKAEFLQKKLKCNRVINYKKENLYKVLKNEYPNGIDVVFESVGGQLFEDCLNNIASKGKIIVIGAISGYQNDSAWKKSSSTDKTEKSSSGTPLTMKLLRKSASVRGFFLNDYQSEIPKHAVKLNSLVKNHLLNPGLDPTLFTGLESIADALDHMYHGKNIGKLVVHLKYSDKSKL